MGFRTGGYATVWSIEGVKDTRTKGRITVSRKNKQTDQYDTEFSGFVDFIGTAAARKALSLKQGDRIKLGDVDVRNSYNKDTKVTYTYFNIFSFDTVEGFGGGNTSGQGASPMPVVDDGDIDDSDLPF